MGKAALSKPVKLIIGLIFKEENLLNKIRPILTRRFGVIDFESRILPFNFTNYYKEEFGSDLKRVFITFKKLIRPEKLAAIKILTNKIEGKLASGKRRLINIDPGYLDLAKLVLASTKDYVHRIYLARGIYAEVTLYFQDGSFSPGAWTYRDYQTEDYIAVFNFIREIYAKQVK